MKHDKTFHPVSCYGSREWVAQTLGKSVDWFRKSLDSLYAAGFPRPDPIIGLHNKDDVKAWIASRRASQVKVDPSTTISEGVNLDEL